MEVRTRKKPLYSKQAQTQWLTLFQGLTDVDRSMCDCPGTGYIRALAAVENLETRFKGAIICEIDIFEKSTSRGTYIFSCRCGEDNITTYSN